MATITTQNPIRWNIDTLSTQSYGVIASTNNYTVDLTRASTVTGITVKGSQPSGSQRRIAFRVNSAWGKLTTSGTFQAFTNNNAEYANVLANGNTPEQLSSITNASGLAGKRIGIAFALTTTDINNAIPSCGLSFTCKNDTQQLTAYEYSPEYTLGDGSQIISITSETESSDGGSVAVTARARRSDGSLTDWVSLGSLSGMKASAVQIRGEYRATTPGTSSAHIENVKIVYSDGSSIVSGLTHGEVITLTEDWYMPVKQCRLTVKHAPLIQSDMKAYISLRKTPILVKGERLGIGSGGRKTFALKHDDGLKYDTLRLYYDNIQVFTDYELNCEIGRLTCLAPEGVIVSCDYEYNWGMEDWQEMTLSSRTSLVDYDQTEYRYTSPNDDGMSVCALKLVLGMTSGHITNELLGTATGRTQSFKLSRRVNDGKVTITSNYTALAGKNWRLLEDPQYVSVAAPAGQTVRATYDWISETPEVYQYCAVYTE